MLKRLREKWRLWEDAFLGIDDLQGDHLSDLEARLVRLEDEVAGIIARRSRDLPHEKDR